MNPGARDVAQIRLDNALLLFDEFVRATIKYPDAATLRGLEGRFAERLQIQPSYWSQIKGRSRQIGERLARQFEQLCKKPSGWMDEPHPMPARKDSSTVGKTSYVGSHESAQLSPMTGVAHEDEPTRNMPQDDDERFIVGLVLTYYRRHPHRARARLLDLLGEVLIPGQTSQPRQILDHIAPPVDDERALWSKAQAAVKPLKPKR